jgi:two-component system chemotaxis sensor kinase CheA
MDECMPDFLIEAGEALAALNDDLIRLEAAPGDMRLIGGVFRTLHSIKGASGFLGLSRLESVCQESESILGLLRDGVLQPSSHVIALLLRCVAAMQGILDTVATSGRESLGSSGELLAELRALRDNQPFAQTEDAALDPEALQALFDATPGPSDMEPPAAYESMREGFSAGERTVRVSVDALEAFMMTLDQLVQTRDRMLQILGGEYDSPFTEPVQRLITITSELQEVAIRTRMQPIGTVWSALPQLVRDLAYKLGKKIELVMEGAGTQLDRRALELIKDPIIQMIRNAADHGLETPEVRSALGKPEIGRIRLKAVSEGGNVVIELGDDGRGLDVARIRRKAVEHGLGNEAEIIAMSNETVFRFILRPGFSTAAEVTAISGRGVGMDVVRTNIERMGGCLDIASRPNQGATFTITVPEKLTIQTE